MSIETIFDTMDYGTAPEDRSVALQWIADRGGLFGAYVNGAFAPRAGRFDHLQSCDRREAGGRDPVLKR